MDVIKIVARCSCGAVEVESEGQRGYYILAKNLRVMLGVDRLPRARQHYRNCDHCVNHWGLDLCACGSGLATEKCKAGLASCGQPSQVLNERTHFSALGAWV